MAAYIKEKISAHLFNNLSHFFTLVSVLVSRVCEVCCSNCYRSCLLRSHLYSESLLLVSTVDHQWMIISHCAPVDDHSLFFGGFCDQKLLIGDRSA
ncbi:hypothetical protein HanPI659440_Chr13g0505051 [Helianthus annuus]|nr:hypothetical protein HanPI659440_Chr13g0505051 [Helianthus annuus]